MGIFIISESGNLGTVHRREFFKESFLARSSRAAVILHVVQHPKLLLMARARKGHHGAANLFGTRVKVPICVMRDGLVRDSTTWSGS